MAKFLSKNTQISKKMKNSKTILALTVLLAVFFFGFKTAPSPHLHIAKGLITPPDDDLNINRFYWFSVRAKIDDSENRYTISSTGRVSYGTKEKFDKELWKALRRRMLLVGPFPSKDQAIMAQSLYKQDPKKVRLKLDTNLTSTVFWYNVHFVQSPRLRIYVINRVPASVASGSLDAFRNAFYVQLQNQLLPIGPFYMKEIAEESKRIYRQNE